MRGSAEEGALVTTLMSPDDAANEPAPGPGSRHRFHITRQAPIPLMAMMVAGFLAFNFSMNDLYVKGAYTLDTAWFIHLATQPTSFAQHNPPLIGGDFIDVHFSPAFMVLSLLYRAVSAIVPLSKPIFFSLVQAAWSGATAWAVARILWYRRTSTEGGQRPTGALFAAAVFIAGVVSAFSGIGLASISFPHFEVGIPAMLLAGLAAGLTGRRYSAAAFLFVGLTLREDAGLHYAILLLLLAVAMWLHGGRGADRRWRISAVAAAFCLIYSIGAMLYQRSAAPASGDTFSRVYSGDPPFEHLTRRFVLDRWVFYGENRLYIFLPILLLIVLSAYRQSLFLIVPVLATAPWILLSTIVSPSRPVR